jgi:hypothetical protein
MGVYLPIPQAISIKHLEWSLSGKLTGEDF